VDPLKEEAGMEVVGGGPSAYSEEQKPMGSYIVLSGAFAVLIGGMLIPAARSNRLPAGFSAGDVLLLGTATHKLSRVLTRAKVTSWLRAPFTAHEGPAHVNEINDSARGAGLRRAVGELVACPLCMDAWVAAFLLGGFIYRPRVTRTAASLLAVTAISDVLHLGYAPALKSAG
jgi:hypothetical protein